MNPINPKETELKKGKLGSEADRKSRHVGAIDLICLPYLPPGFLFQMPFSSKRSRGRSFFPALRLFDEWVSRTGRADGRRAAAVVLGDDRQ